MSHLGTQDAALDAARMLVRQGLLSEAEQALATVPSQAPAEDRGSVELLRGNIAYERGEYEVSARAWERAAELFREASPGSDAARVATGNLVLAHERIERQLELAGEASHLRLLLVVVLLAAGALVALGHRLSAPSAAAGRPADT